MDPKSVMDVQLRSPDGSFSSHSTPNRLSGSQMDINVDMDLSNDNSIPSPDDPNEVMEIRQPNPEDDCLNDILEGSGATTISSHNASFDTSLFVSQDLEDWSLMHDMLGSSYFPNPVVFRNPPQNEQGTGELVSTNEGVYPVASQTSIQESAEGTSTSEPVIDFDWPDDTEVDDGSRFTEAQNHFGNLENPSVEDFVKFCKAKRRENSRQKHLEARQIDEHFEDLESAIDDATMNSHSRSPSPSSMDNSKTPDEAENPGDKETNAKSSNLSQKPARASTRQKSIFISLKEKKKAMEVGLSSIVGVNKLTNELYSSGKGTVISRDNAPGNSNKGGTRKNKTKFTEEDLCKMLATKDIIASAQVSASMRQAPVSQHKNKYKALAELVASIPTSDRDEARSDGQRILYATRQFNRKPRHDGHGRWKIIGMKTPLMHHQILATGWMRERERSLTHPLGGLLCDIMGFGKTLTALTNILDDGHLGQSPQRAPSLVIVPSSLLRHWAQQISQHFDSSKFGSSMEYSGRIHFDESHTIQQIKGQALVLTTYGEVRQSYPATKPPRTLESKEEVEDWWIQNYDREVGLLHKIKWHRILLDEGHIIKNAESQTSVAVQALTGNFKWILSGTPLHNCIEELYPYFHFLGVPKSWSFQAFQKQFFNPDDPPSMDRLINTVRSFLHRQTHESRLFGTAIVRFPSITEDTVTVKFCEAENLLYEKIADAFLERINDLSGPGNFRSQKRCILTMFLKMRMFASHLLTAQDMIQYILDNDAGALDSLDSLQRNRGSDAISIQIAKLICAAKSGNINESANSSTEGLKQRPSGNLTRLTKAFRDLTANDREEELDERYKCPYCWSDPLPAIITSCGHLYCEECFNAQPDKDGNLDTTKSRICCGCKVPIEEAAYWSGFDNISRFQGPPSSRKRRRQPMGKKKPATGPSLRKSFTLSKTYGMFHLPLLGSTNADQNEEEDDGADPEDELIQDWIPLIGRDMPGAKITKTRDIVKSWIEKDPKSKIVIFTFFLDTIRLLEFMCNQEGWITTKLSGKMAQDARNDSVFEFQTNKDVKVMIATYKTGGYGLDFSVANKCILMDLWWNEAVQEQAYGRLLRLNQCRLMECIKIIAESTHDEAMLTLQLAKTQRIEEVVSLKVLEERASIQQLLEYFGDVTEARGGGFRVTRFPKAKKKKTSKDKNAQDPKSKGGMEGETA